MKFKLVVLMMVLAVSMNAFAMGKGDSDKKEVENAGNTATKEVKCEKDAKCCSTGEKCCKDGKEKCDKHSESCDKDSKSCDAKAPCEMKKQAEAKPASVVEKDMVVVTVNGDKIMKSEINKIIAPQIERMEAMGGGDPARLEKMKTQLIQRAGEMLVMDKLVEAKLKEKGMEVTQAQIDEKFAEYASKRNMSVEEFKAQVMQSGMSEAELNDRMRMGLRMETLMQSESEGEMGEVNEAKAKEYYESNTERFQQPEQVKASHILIGTKDMDEEKKAEAKKEAEQVLSKVKEGEDFAALAKENSSCPSSAKGGDLGYFQKGQMVPAFSDAAFSMKPGDVSDIVETRFGYHIIKVTDKKDARTVPFEEVKTDIMEMLKQQERQSFAKDYIDKLKEDANIVWAAEYEIKPVQMPVSKAPAKSE